MFINHEIIYDAGMKRHLCPICPPYDRAGGDMHPSFPRSLAPLGISIACMSRRAHIAYEAELHGC